MSNYKTEATAYDLADELARRTGLPCTWGYVSGVPTVRVGVTTLKTAGGIAIQIQDRRGEADGNWDALPGFNGTSQPVYNTGVAKLVSEALVDVSVAPAFATGTLTLTNPTPLDNNVVINGVTLTAGTHFVAGATDDISATNLAAAINAHPTLSGLVTAVANPGGAGNSTVVITAKIAGAAGNAITTTETATAAAWGGATLTGGAGASQGAVLSQGVFMKVWAAVSKRGLKVEHWQTAVGTPPMSDNSTMSTSYFQGEFFPNDFWPLSGQV